MPGRGPKIIHGVDGHALLACAGEIGGHTGAHHVAPLDDHWVDVWVNRIEPRRDKHSGCIGALLMYVINDLRVPDVMQLFDSGTSFRLRENVPIAVVVMAHVAMI